ncbi:hypothetical protein BDV24DRAFT_166765 [Aspergillus arachidicola]|uniref:Uncharacterized protein n=1 Tax=Aspergillus arachidicola TaxID=656916 RepID=A0A5N6Y0F0_9EURO|nr:hypothetical protein BDV24DRAFT_166765 [Aspergillus arachidicola]
MAFSKDDNNYVSGIFAEVPDKKPSIKGALYLSRLLSNLAYNIYFSAGGFLDDEYISITVDLLELDSTVAAVARDILRDTEIYDNSINTLTFGFSKASFAHLIVPPTSLPEVEFPIVYIDVDAEELVIAVLAQVSVQCRPAIVTRTKEILELQFIYAKLLGSISINIRDPSAETGIAGGFASIVEFKKSINNYIIQITNKSGDLGFALPVYLESRPLPDYWHRVLNIRLEFLRFQYKTVKIYGRPILYLFLVFSMSSLNLLLPCYYKQPSLTQTVLETDESSTLTVFEALQQQTKYRRLLPKKWSKTVTENRTNYTDILGAALSTSIYRAIYASVRFWYNISLKTAKIGENNIEAIRVGIDLAGEGSAKAAIRDRCGHDVLRESRPYISVNSTEPREMTIVAVADARVGKPDIDFDFPGAPPPPLDQAINWVLTQLVKDTRDSVGKIASDQLSIRLVRTVEDNGAIRLRFAANEFFKDEAFVLLGQLWSQS